MGTHTLAGCAMMTGTTPFPASFCVRAGGTIPRGAVGARTADSDAGAETSCRWRTTNLVGAGRARSCARARRAGRKMRRRSEMGMLLSSPWVRRGSTGMMVWIRGMRAVRGRWLRVCRRAAGAYQQRRMRSQNHSSQGGSFVVVVVVVGEEGGKERAKGESGGQVARGCYKEQRRWGSESKQDRSSRHKVVRRSNRDGPDSWAIGRFLFLPV